MTTENGNGASELVAGGEGARRLNGVLREIGAAFLPSFAELRRTLRRLAPATDPRFRRRIVIL